MPNYKVLREQDLVISPLHEGELSGESLPKIGEDIILPRSGGEDQWFRVVGIVHKPLEESSATIVLVHGQDKPNLTFWGTEGF